MGIIEVTVHKGRNVPKKKKKKKVGIKSYNIMKSQPTCMWMQHIGNYNMGCIYIEMNV